MRQLISLKVFVWVVVLIYIFIFTACQKDRLSSDFDITLIDQHLDHETDFQERYRPQFHYTPIMNWMNDPNGLVYYEGKYHLFHQYNPFGNRWGYMSWYHAVSEDLVHWEHRPVAIPYGKEEEEAIFSGSAVVDHYNTTGFGDDSRAPLVAIYTSHYTREDGSTWQAQSLAYSTDGGKSFQKYEGNPVLMFDDPDFRDPNVFWMDEQEKWVMVVALPTQHKVQFYESKNLMDWNYLSDFGPAGAIGGIWECPDLFPLAVDGDPGNIRWVLHVDINPGAIAGGSGSQFFIGDWDGTYFTPDESIMNNDIIWADYGTDFYAAITWSDIPEEDGRRLWVGWMNNWLYANEIPTNPWRSAQSIPRSIHLKSIDGTIRPVQKPVVELQMLRNQHIQLQEIQLSDDSVNLTDSGIYGNSFEMIIEIEPGDSKFTGLKVRSGNGDETVVGYDAENGTAFIDRTNSGESGFYEGFAQRNDAPVRLINGRVKLHLFVDWSSIEVFINDGEAVITNRIFPEPDSQDIIFYSSGGDGSIQKLDFWHLNSIW